MSERASPKPSPKSRSAYLRFEHIQTRWADNDVYGHVNNVSYYAWFDTAINAMLIAEGLLDIQHGKTIGLVVHTECNYFASIAFPQRVQLGIAVAKLGTSSVVYELGVFGDGAQSTAAIGRFTHVYVDRATHQPVPLPPALRTCLLQLHVPTTTST